MKFPAVSGAGRQSALLDLHSVIIDSGENDLNDVPDLYERYYMLEQARILVVDDEKIIREGCSRILRKDRHLVETASDGATAVEMVRKEPFDIIILDIKMPAMDGMQVMETLKSDISGLLFIVITGYGTIETAVEAMKAGAYDFLLKPFSADALRIGVNRALDHLRLSGEMEELRREKDRSLKDIANEQSRIRTIINSMACGILVTDDSRNLVLVNPMAPQMLKIDSCTIVGQPFSRVIPHKELNEMVEKIFDRKTAGYAALEHEFMIDRHLWLRARAAPVRDVQDNIMGVVTVLQDVTHLKEMDRMKSEFVTMVSHELKAPLAAIQQQLEVLSEGITGEVNERQKHFLNRARIRSRQLIDLIDELLDLSRIEAGTTVSNQEYLDLSPVITRSVEFLKSHAENKSQTIKVNVPDSLPAISADPRNMDEIMINLLNNAIKYTPEGGGITVKAGKSGDFVRITISDTGYGIPQDAIPRIFDKFYRVKNERTRKISGSGLGLPIVKGIVEMHLGTIKVDSKIGEGTTVTIEFPIVAPAGTCPDTGTY